MAICVNCGREFENDDMHVVNGNLYCDACFENPNVIVICESCDEPIERSDAYETRDGFVCHDCYSWHYTTCENCGEIVPYDNAYGVRGLDGYVCDSCIDEYHYCDECGTYVTDYYWDDDDDCCIECAENAHVHSYHRMKSMCGYRDSGTVFQCGVELEIEKRGDTSIKKATDLLREKLGETVTFEHDSSLVNGFEIITQPIPFNDWMNWLEWYECLTWLKEHGFRSHDGGNCGLHLHIDYRAFGHNDSARDLNIAKILYLYERRFSDFVCLSRRGASTGYCEPYTYSKRISEYKDAHEIAKFGKQSFGRYRAINLTNIGSNCNTVEFRLGRGTLNTRTFRAWLDMHFALVRNCASINVGNIDFPTWFNGADTDTIEYIKERTC